MPVGSDEGVEDDGRASETLNGEDDEAYYSTEVLICQGGIFRNRSNCIKTAEADRSNTPR